MERWREKGKIWRERLDERKGRWREWLDGKMEREGDGEEERGEMARDRD